MALLGAFSLLPAAYASENGGAIFQHLTTQPGAGAGAKKSKDELRGHTDAVFHALPGEARTGCSVSPDFVVLIGLRNPGPTYTRVISLTPLLKLHLAAHEVSALLDPVFDVSPQPSFALGGLVEHDLSLAKHSAHGYVMRYSNTKVVADPHLHPKQDAVLQKVSSILTSPPPGLVDRVAVNPGDILFINNRVALHGRDKVAHATPGGSSRWIVRTYGVNASSVPLHPQSPGACVLMP